MLKKAKALIKNNDNNRYKNYYFFFFLFFLLIVIFTFFFFSTTDFLKIDNLENFINSFGKIAILIFSFLYIFLSLFGLSTVVLTVLAGTIFGIYLGLVIVVFSATISASIAFFISRFFSKFFDESKLKNKMVLQLINKIEEKAKNNGFTGILLLRLSFFPYIPLSYAGGLVKNLKAKDFILATFLTNIFGSFVFIFLGASLFESIPIFLFAIFLVFVFFQIPKIINKSSIRNRKK